MVDPDGGYAYVDMSSNKAIWASIMKRYREQQRYDWNENYKNLTYEEYMGMYDMYLLLNPAGQNDAGPPEHLTPERAWGGEMAQAWESFDAGEWSAGLLNGYSAGKSLGLSNEEATKFSVQMSKLAGGGYYELWAWKHQMGSSPAADDPITSLYIKIFASGGNYLGSRYLWHSEAVLKAEAERKQIALERYRDETRKSSKEYTPVSHPVPDWMQGVKPRYQGTISQYNPGLAERWRTGGFLKSTTYSIVNGAWVTVQSLTLGASNATQLNGESVTGKDATNALVNTVATLLPIKAIGIETGPLRNWIRIGNTFDNAGNPTFGIRWGAGNNKYLNQIPNRALREFNSWLRQQGSGHWHWWKR
jgi:hypothetical protein